MNNQTIVLVSGTSQTGKTQFVHEFQEIAGHDNVRYAEMNTGDMMRELGTTDWDVLIRDPSYATYQQMRLFRQFKDEMMHHCQSFSLTNKRVLIFDRELADVIGFSMALNLSSKMINHHNDQRLQMLTLLKRSFKDTIMLRAVIDEDVGYEETGSRPPAAIRNIVQESLDEKFSTTYGKEYNLHKDNHKVVANALWSNITSDL